MNAKPSSGAGYAGDVSPVDAWQGLEANPKAQLVDVRTRAEWTYVGLPDLGALSRRALLAEWQTFPAGTPNGRFAAEVDEALKDAGATTDTPIYFICRSGARSRAAAIALTQMGYAQAFNVAGGFEGDHDDSGHRGQVNGWKADGLPWQQG